MTQAPLALVPSIQAPSAGLFKKKASKSVTLAKETVTPDKDVTSEEVLSSTQVVNFRFVNEIKDPCIDKAHEKSRLVVQAHNDDKILVLIQSLKIQRAYNINRDFYIRSPRKPISLLGDSSDSIVKVIIPLHDVSEASTNQFAIYHLHYNEKLGMTESAYDPCLLYSNELVDNQTWTFSCNTKPGVVTKKGEPPRIFLHFHSDALQLLSFMLSLMLSKMRPAMFEYLAMFKCVPISEWPLENLPEAFFDSFLAA